MSTGLSKLRRPSEAKSDKVPIFQRVASPLASHGKRRPSLLHKERKTDSKSSLEVQKHTQSPTATKRRFSLRDVVRKILSGKQKVARTDDDAGENEGDIPIIFQDTIYHGNEINDGTHRLIQSRDSGTPPSRTPLVETSRSSAVPALTRDGEGDEERRRPSSATLTPPTSSSSRGSVRSTSTSPLSPRPTGNQRYTRSSPDQVLHDGDQADDDISSFEGAPIFYVDESEGKYGSLLVRYQMREPSGSSAYATAILGDAKPIDHEAFRSCSNRNKQDPGSHHHWLEGPVETPSMLSFFGLEPGTTGWQYFLEAQMEDYELQQGLPGGDIDEYGFGYQPQDSIGVRSIDSTIMVDRLRDIGKLHGQGYKLEADLDTETRALYGQLFSKLLYPARRRSETTKPQEVSLESQCRELFKVLEARHVWLDFTRPEERIRLGSILYGDGEEKMLLMLQILLSCELWLRLKLLHKYLPGKLELESLYFTPKVNWDLSIAQKWLKNMRIVERVLIPDTDMLLPVPPQMQNPSVWHRFFSVDGIKIEDNEDTPEGDAYDAFFVPQHLERQLDGLLHFARKIGWPGIEMLEGVVRDKLRDPAGLQTPGSFLSYKTAPNSPSRLTPRSTGGSSYFGYFTGKHTSSAIVRNLGQGGWLSRTYTAGLILPGEGLPHLLMGCLLENDTLALNEIGEQGSMYGGIVRTNLDVHGATSSWWSMNNIVGKVLATEVARSYAGWVGKCVGIYHEKKALQDNDIPIISAVAAQVVRKFTSNPSTDTKENNMKLVEPSGWMDVIADRKSSARRLPRLLSPESIELDSRLMTGSSSSTSDQPPVDELHFPENAYIDPEDFQIQVVGLKFWDLNSPLSVGSTEPEHGYSPTALDDPHASSEVVPAYRVEVVFQLLTTSPTPTTSTFAKAENDIVSVILQHDVSFITSYPCFSPGGRSRVESPVDLFETVSQDLGSMSKSARCKSGSRKCRHPIRSSLQYKIVDLRGLHEHKPARRKSAGRSRASSSAKKDKGRLEDYFVTVICATDLEADAYVYAKSWCAKWGADAVVARPERTCLSCAVREAYALGVDAVITI
ncbi:hypothetical protein ABW21_db0208683 [Orbilia brochopaga]|nr:hypothetical protein ABW21_db0208683 [Drechslerella brochopaga]